MEFLLLGPVEVRVEGRAVALPRRQQRALLAALLLRPGEVVSTDRLVDELWGEDPPASAVGSLQNAVSQLRKALGAEVVRTKPPGYVLAVEPEAVDARRFERLLAESAGLEPGARARTLREALALWRGPALADVADAPWAEMEAARLEALRLTALEERIEAELELGLHGPLVAQLEALVAEHPLRERLSRQLGLALYRDGRQAEALDALRLARERLDELGLEPSAELKQLERDILQQSPALAAPAVEIADEIAAEIVGERRVVSVLAASVAEDEDPEALRAALARVLAAANAAVARHGGELERFGPEGLVAVFGANAGREDDALRAVRAGVELHEAAGVGVGIATGEAVVAEEPRVAGAAVARAAGLARAGEGVLLDPRTYELVRESVSVETAGPLSRVLAVAATRPEGGLDVPLVGRQAELERLRSGFATARDERRCVTATVTGEAGIGKTRLARELVASLDATVLIGRCAAYGEGATFLPLVEALHGIDAGIAGDELVERRIEGLTGAQEPGSLGESYWAVRRLLEALAAARPVVLVLDDVHWAEPALLDLIEYLRDRVNDAPLLVLCLARPELLDDRPGWAADALRLEPLAEDQTRELVTNTAAELEDEARDRIVELAEGNPLYAQQLAAYAAESGKALEPGAMPASIDAVLAGRLGRLDAGERATLQRAAVVGREFSRGAVAALAPPDLAVDAHLLALTRRGFVRAQPDPLPGDDAYRFHHVLLRDAAYATLTKEQRADFHERVANWLDRDRPGDDAIVGYHLEQAARLQIDLGDAAPDIAAAAGERLGQAGLHAWARGDLLAANGLLERAIALVPTGARQLELLWELAIGLRVAGRVDEADRALARAEAQGELAGDRHIQARIRISVAQRGLDAGELSPEDVLDVTSRMIPILEEEDDPRGLARAWLAVGSAENFRCRNDAMGAAAAEAERYYDRAAFYSAAPLGSQAAALYHGTTPAEEAFPRCEELLERARDRASRANVVGILGALHGLLSHFAEARDLLEECRTLYDELGMRPAESTFRAQWAYEVERLAGSPDVAREIARRSLEELLHLGYAAWAATRAVQLADVTVDLGEPDAAAGHLDVAREHAAPHDVLVAFMIDRVAARLASRTGDHFGAVDLARRAVEIGDRTDDLSARAETWLAYAEVLQLAGRADESTSAMTEAVRLFRLKGSVAGVARAKHVAALVGA